MWLAYSFLPEKLKPRRIPLDAPTHSFTKTLGISSVLGAGTVVIFVAASLLGLSLEDFGVLWLSSMSTTGFILFLVSATIGLSIVMRLLMGYDNTKKSLSSVGIERLKIKEHVSEILKNLIIAGVAITWFLIWLAIAGMPDTSQPNILLVLVKWPVGVRGINTLILMILAIPFFLVEASWIRGILLSNREWSGSFQNTKHLIFSVISKFAIAGLLTIIVIFGTTAVGVSSGRIVLLGVVWVRIIIVQFLASVILTWSALKFENTWSTVIVSAFLLSLVIVTTVPLI